MSEISKFVTCLLWIFFLWSPVQAQRPSLVGFQRQVQRRVARDQAVRFGLMQVPLTKNGEFNRKEHNRLMQRASDVDEDNVAWLRKQVAKLGVPDPSVLGKQTADGFFLLILHADRDRKLQQKCLGLMKETPGQWPKSYIQRLETRVKFPPPLKIKLTPNETKNESNDSETAKPDDQGEPPTGPTPAEAESPEDPQQQK